jgi:hypothetical protein
MKAIATEATERSIPGEDALRLVIDTTRPLAVVQRELCCAIFRNIKAHTPPFYGKPSVQLKEALAEANLVCMAPLGGFRK